MLHLTLKLPQTYPLKFLLQLMHLLQGLAVGFLKEEQFNPIAIILAIVVFPTPLIPVNKMHALFFYFQMHFLLF